MKQIILPTYTTKLPSTGKTVTFRPFTIKEEKALLLALQENNLETVGEALKNTISVCTYGTIDSDQTPYYDIEYLFLQIRSKSVGEVLDLSGTCDCKENATTKFSVDLATLKVEPSPSENPKIKIPDTNYTVVMSHPTLSHFISAFMTSNENSGTDTVAKCIQSVYSTDEVFDWTLEEKMEFVESMTPIQQKGIAKYLNDMPMVKLDVSYTCKHCGKHHDQIMSGFENFFL